MILQWLFLTFGITLVITGSSILRPVRQMDPTGLLKCPMCTGWWVGLLLSLVFQIGLFPILRSPLTGMPWGALGNAFSASGWCWFIHVMLVRLNADKL